MANNNQVTITLRADGNQASAVISGLSNQINRDLSGSLGRATLGANLMTGAISAGLQRLTSLIGNIGGKLNEVMDIQQGNIATAGTLMKLVGFTFKEASDYIDQFSSNMAKVASTLPGATSDYVKLGKGIMDNLVPAFKTLNGSFDKKGYTEALNDITRDAGFLASANKTDIGLTSQGISKFLAGRSVKELAQSKFFEDNPAILSLIESEADKLGIDLEKSTERQRVDILRTVLATPKEVLLASSNSLSGLIEGFKSSLIDPNTGLFGLMRDLSEKSGSQTALHSITDAVKSLIGEGGLFEQTSKALAGLGIVLGDPMVKLKSAADDFTESVKQITSIFQEFNNRRPGQTLDDSKETLEEDLKYYFSNLFDFTTLGKSLAKIVNGIFNGIFAFIWSGGLQSLIGGIAKGLGAFLTNLDWSVYATILSGILVKKYLTIAFIKLGALIATRILASGAWTYALGFMGPIGAGLLQLGAFIGGTVGTGGALLIAALLGFLAYGIWKNRDFIGKKLQELGKGIDKFFAGIIGWFRDELDKIPGGSSINQGLDSVAHGNEQIKEATGGKVNIAAILASTGLFSYLSSKAVGTLRGDIPNSYNGLNTSSLMNAANKELAKAPPGAGLVMANSSETILNSSQQARIMSAMSSKPEITKVTSSKPSITIGAINIHTAATNAQEIAKDVVACIERELQNFGQNYVAAPVV